MRNISKLFVILSMLITIIVPVKAVENVTFYAYTSDTIEFDEYAKEELGIHIYTYYGNVDNTLKLGNGIKVFGDISNPLVIYPIWKNNEIVATFKVVNINGIYSGSYSEGNASQLNYAKDISSGNNPMKLFRYDDQFLYSIGNTVYDATTGDGLVVLDINLNEIDFSNGTTIDAFNTLEYQQIKNTRTSDSYNLYWDVPEHNPNNLFSCYAYCLSAILRCSGYRTYTVTKVKDGVAEAAGSSIHLAAATLVNLKTFLNNEGFTYSASSSENG